jgi:acyl transferase domain-containing protein/SAM-dependent methyltransferase/acyl carrier protein
MSEELNGAIESVAIIGMACRFPGAEGLERFWQNLRDGVESITFFSDEALTAAGVDPATLSDPRYVKARGRLDGYDLFDASFFGFTPTEAAVTDPQHRLFLECAWEAMEHAGYDPRRSGEGTGVFAGAGFNTYALRNLMASPGVLAREGEYRVLIGNDKDFVATRTSYKLNLKGPSLNISTACSTSLVAVHTACNGLLAYQCDMALAGAVSIYIPQDQGYLHEAGGILSADGHCRPFSADAGGTVGGAGVGIVVLKRLTDALADGDTVHAVILGTAVNNDGADKIGFTAPSVEGQARVIIEAQSVAGVSPDSIGYVEAHGTGTALGDPIELAALARAFSRRTGRGDVCFLGSVKSNFGHCDTAAGMAGLIKTVLALKNQAIPPTLHCKRTHPEIDFAATPFRVNSRLEKWPRVDTPRRAGVSSFGVGGTNAHIILEEAPPAAPSPGSRPWFLLPLSARTRSALDSTAANLAEFLATNPAVDLGDLAFTLQVGRSRFSHRRTILCHDRQDAIAALLSPESAVSDSRSGESDDRQIAFLFSGQGTQYVGMAADLYRSEVLFRTEVDRCAVLLQPLIGRDIRQVLFAGDPEKPAAELLLEETSITQPALFVVEYALARLMIAIGIVPEACIGHSLGEYVAACIGGVFSLEDGLRLVARRGALMQEMAKGAMTAVSMAPGEIPAELLQGLSVAAVNTAHSCVLSGPSELVAEVEEKLGRLDVASKRLHTSHAFHSAMMVPVVRRLIEEFSALELHPPAIPLVANVTGTWMTDRQATDPEYWCEHLLRTVRFADGLATLFAEAPYTMVEIGPGHTLASFALGHPLRTDDHTVRSVLPHARTADADHGLSFGACLGKLWLAGARIDWLALHKGENRRRIPLPTYPFERQRFFIAPSAATGPKSSKLRQDPADWFYRPSWKRGVIPADRDLKPIKRWLIFTDSLGLGRTLGKTLQDDGVNFVAVADGSPLEQNEGYAIDPRDKNAYLRLLQDLAGDGNYPDSIIYCWSLNALTNPSSPDSTAAGRMLCYDALILLAQALEQCKPGHPITLTVVTAGMFDVIGNERLAPVISLVMGPVTVLPQEHPHMVCRAVDIADASGAPRADGLMIKALAALCRSHSAEPFIALRGRHCWLRTFEPLSFPAVSSRPAIIRPGGVYLIAGGMGGIGLQLAEYLAKTAGARLLLVGRKALSAPGESDWRAAQRELEKIERECAIRSIGHRGSFKPRLNRLCAALVVRYLHRSGIDTAAGSCHDVKKLEQQLGISPKFTRLFGFLLAMLAEDGLAKFVDGRIIFSNSTAEPGDPDAAAVSLAEEFPAFRPMILFLGHCADRYPRALTSEKEAISVLYPKGDAAALGKIASEIEEHTYHRIYCLLLAEQVRKLVDAAGGRLVRILEIGGGAGILTKHILPLIAGKNVEYTFTDIGPSFVAEAKTWAREFDHHAMRFGTLDVSRDFTAQGFRAGQFDAIVELDVVHATPRIASTLVNLKRLLAPAGQLLMAESTGTPRWTTMIYGLAEGWWYYQDTDLREKGPLLGPDKWQSVMTQAGFDLVQVYPLDTAKRLEHDCCLVIGRVGRVGRLEEMGAQVRTYAADISDRAPMEAVVEAAEAEFGTIHGVIHSAAIENRGPIQLKEAGGEGAEFAAKVHGTMVLDDLFKHRPLDFMIVCSSITAILGGVGDVEYTAVNAFADAYAQTKAGSTDRCTIAIDWDRWIGTGMAAAFEQRFRTLSGGDPWGGMSAEEGGDAFARILANPHYPQIVVSTRPFGDWIDEARTGTSTAIAGRVSPPVAQHARPELQSAYAAPIGDSQKTIAAVWQEVLGIERIGIHDVFSEIGGDSLIAIKVVARLGECFATTITVRALFENPTVARLAEHIEALRAVAVAQENKKSSDDGLDMDEGTL